MSILTSPENSLPNPLLSRTKLKPIKKSKSKTKSSKSSSPLPPATPIEELETDSLADSLLEQLDIKEAEVPAVVKPAWLHKEEHHQEKEKSQGTFGFIKGKLSNISIAAGGDKKASRQELRKTRMASQLRLLKANADAEVLAANDQSIKEELDAINAGCAKLGVQIKEIDPDGHCLYSAVADQANLLGLSENLLTYTWTRSLAASCMRSNPNDFLPFLPSPDANSDGEMTEKEFEQYCQDVESSGEWGGQPEILALSKGLGVPIHVLQAGTDIVKIGEPDEGEVESAEKKGPILISYHRKMYGLGEHYNSLIPAAPSSNLPNEESFVVIDNP